MKSGQALCILMNAVYDQRYSRDRLRTLVDALHRCTEREEFEPRDVTDELKAALVAVMADDLSAVDRIAT